MNTKLPTNLSRAGSLFVTSDGLRWKSAILAADWQRLLNRSKKAKTAPAKVKVKSVPAKPRKPRAPYGTGQYVGVSPERNRAIKAFVVKYDVARTGNKVVSMNRLLWAIQGNSKALKEFAELMLIP